MSTTALLPRGAVLPENRAFWRRWELPTWGVAIAIYASWFGLLMVHKHVPWPIEALLAAYILAWHFSLQHEAIHGWRSLPEWLRTAIVWPPIGGWWPFEIYKRSHTKHHRNTYLTYPGEDTETQYHKEEDWSGYSPFFRQVLLFNQTFVGRLTAGPILRLRKLFIVEFGKLRRSDYSDVPAWLRFFAGLAMVLWIVRDVADMPIWHYYLVWVLPGISLGLLRAFIEHRWGDKPGERTASVESNWVFGLLFLWNNLHIVHHLYPTMAWFEIPGFWRANRQKLLEHNGHFVFPGYYAIARRWLFTPVFVPIHPASRTKPAA
jgi:fatty acid desaturase